MPKVADSGIGTGTNNIGIGTGASNKLIILLFILGQTQYSSTLSINSIPVTYCFPPCFNSSDNLIGFFCFCYNDG